MQLLRRKRKIIALVLLIIVILITYFHAGHSETGTNDQPAVQDENSVRPDGLKGIEKIFVITLESVKNRREHMERMVRHHQLDVEWWPATTPDSFTVKMLRDNIHTPADMRGEKKSPFIWACYASHVSIYEEIVRKGYKNALILEDDVDFDLNFRPRWNKLYDRIRNDPWDLLMIGHCVPMKYRFKTGWLVPHGISCTHGYVVSNEFAKKFISTSDYTTRAVDMVLSDFCKSINCKLYATSSMLVAQLPRDKDRNPSTLLDDVYLGGQQVPRSTAIRYPETRDLFFKEQEN